MATHLSESASAVPSRSPGISANWRRTSMMIAPAACAKGEKCGQSEIYFPTQSLKAKLQRLPHTYLLHRQHCQGSKQKGQHGTDQDTRQDHGFSNINICDGGLPGKG